MSNAQFDVHGARTLVLRRIREGLERQLTANEINAVFELVEETQSTDSMFILQLIIWRFEDQITALQRMGRDTGNWADFYFMTGVQRIARQKRAATNSLSTRKDLLELIDLRSRYIKLTTSPRGWAYAEA